MLPDAAIAAACLTVPTMGIQLISIWCCIHDLQWQQSALGGCTAIAILHMHAGGDVHQHCCDSAVLEHQHRLLLETIRVREVGRGHCSAGRNADGKWAVARPAGGPPLLLPVHHPHVPFIQRCAPCRHVALRQVHSTACTGQCTSVLVVSSAEQEVFNQA